MTLTIGQQVTLDHVTARPQRACDIAKAAGLFPSSTAGHLRVLASKGLVRKNLSDRTWERAHG